MDLIAAGKRIKQLSRAQNLTQKSLARRSGIPESSLSDVIKGKKSASIEKFAIIAEVLKVDLHWLIFGHSFQAETHEGAVAEKDGRADYLPEKQRMLNEISDILLKLDKEELTLIRQMAERFISKSE